MALTADQLATVRDEIGIAAPPSDGDLDGIYLRKGGLVGVVRVVWQQRLAVLLALPASFTVSGEYGQNTGDNMRAIKERLAELAGLPDDSDLLPPVGSGDGVLTVAYLERAGDECGAR